ncbi:MAG: hypothetical protein R3Y35_07225 [Clostridia bacterium]
MKGIKKMDLETYLSNIERLKIELNYQTYYNDFDLHQFLLENGLEPSEKYSKSQHQAQLLQTVIDILESLMNNIDNFRKVQTEFTTTTEAYSYLKDRINQIERKIASIPNIDITTSNVTFMYRS